LRIVEFTFLFFLMCFCSMKAAEKLPKALFDKRPQKRMAAMQKIEDQHLLTMIATQAEYSDVRTAAVLSIKDQAIILKCALEDADPFVRIAAVGKLTDETALAALSSRDLDARVRRAAVWQLTDQKALAKIAVEDTDSKVRLAAVGKVTDEEALIGIASDGRDPTIRMAVIVKLTDQRVLGTFARTDTDARVRETAIDKLADSTTLTKIALDDKDSNVRSAALKKLIDQSVLSKIALQDEDANVRTVAVGMLTDQAILAKIAIEDKGANVRKSAVSRVSDQTLLVKIALEARDSAERRTAFGTLNRESLAGIVKTVGGEREVYLARRSASGSTAVLPRQRWRISGEEGDALMESLLFDYDGNYGKAIPAGVKLAVKTAQSACDQFKDIVMQPPFNPLSILPALPNDSFALEVGNIVVAGKEIPSPLAFRRGVPSIPTNERARSSKLWLATRNVDGTVSTSSASKYLEMRLIPFLFLTKGHEFVLAGSIATSNVTISTDPSISLNMQFSFSDLTPQLVDLAGSIRLSADWRDVGQMWVKGGGLVFDDTGVSLMPTTQYISR